MTEATGSEPSEVVGTPWDKKWNEVKQEVAEVAAPVAEAVKSVAGPWERMWGGDKPPAPKKIVPKPSTPIAVSGDWATINQKYQAGQADRDAGRLEILKQELAKETKPESIAALKREISRETNRKK